MSGLSNAHRSALSAVLSQCPDSRLGALNAAIQSMTGAWVDELKQMVIDEVEDRRRRDLVLEPFLPMFRGRSDDVEGLVFPSPVLPRLWKAIRSDQGGLATDLPYDAGLLCTVADKLCAAGARLLREQPEIIWPESVGEDGLADLIGCLELSPFVRNALPSLPAWMSRADDAEAAGLRLLFKDCAEHREDGGRLLLEVLFAHLPNPTRILRIVTQTSRSAGNERFLSGSELGVFVDRMIGAVRARALSVSATRPDGDTARIKSAVADIHWCSGALNELDVVLSLNPSGQWGQEVAEARALLIRRITSWLKAAPDAVGKALPLVRVPVAGRMSRLSPRLDAPIDGPEVRMAQGLCRIVGALRGAVATFGCEAERFSAAQDIEKRLFDYADEALQMVNDGEVEDRAHAVRLIRFAADWLQFVGSDVTAESVRRRAAVALTPRPDAGASSRAA